MDSTLIIPILCIAIGLMAGMMSLSYFKTRDKVEKKTKGKNTAIIEKPTVEFSKKILYVSYAIAIVVIIYTMYIVHMMVTGGYTGDPTSLNTLITLTLGELIAANSFYYNKAKAENIIKVKNEYGNDSAELARKTMKNEDY